jgi:hypothetical protein
MSDALAAGSSADLAMAALFPPWTNTATRVALILSAAA